MVLFRFQERFEGIKAGFYVIIFVFIVYIIFIYYLPTTKATRPETIWILCQKIHVSTKF